MVNPTENQWPQNDPGTRELQANLPKRLQTNGQPAPRPRLANKSVPQVRAKGPETLKKAGGALAKWMAVGSAAAGTGAIGYFLFGPPSA